MADAIHLSLTGIKGESTSKRHREVIFVESWSWGVAVTPPGPGGGGSSVNRPAFAPFTFTHRVDTASPPLWRACVTGQHIAEGILSVARPMTTVWPLNWERRLPEETAQHRRVPVMESATTVIFP